MKKFLLSLFLIFNCMVCFADNQEMSKQATAFYSDNNHVRTMDMILQINEKDRTAQDWILLGNVLADNGKTEDAAYMYKKAIDTDKKSYRAYYNLGIYYYDKGMFDRAIESYTAASKIKNDNPYIYYNLANVYIRLEEYGKAKTNLNKAIMYDSKVPEFHYNLAYTYKQLGKDKLARTYLYNYNKLINPEQ